MPDPRNNTEPTARPGLTTIHSDDGLEQESSSSNTTPIKRVDTAPTCLASPSSTRSKIARSSTLRREKTDRSNRLKRSETMMTRPPLARVPSTPTRYMEMLLHLDEIPRLYNISASLFTWIILAGYLVVPGTFTTFKETKAFQDADSNQSDGQVAHDIVNSIAHVGLLWLAGSFCVVGTVGCLALWIRWRQNYVWLINKIFTPVTFNSIAGLVTTLVNVYTAQSGVWSVTARVTAIVTGSCAIGAGFLFLVYNFGLLRSIHKSHERDLGIEHQHDDETLVEKVKRKAHEPPLQSGDIV